jgi:DnaJ-class molecular chaperone
LINGKTYYQILGVLNDAEDIVIRAAYKALAQKYHPDKWTGSKEEVTQRMSEINQAYHVLTSMEKKLRYDEEIADFALSRRSVSEKSTDFDSVADSGNTPDVTESKRSKIKEALWFFVADFQRTTKEEREKIKNAWFTGVSLFLVAMVIGLLLT